MKILQVITSFPPAYAYGGPVRSVYELSMTLVSRGHDVTVYTTDVLDSDSRNQAPQVETMDGITVRRFKNVHNGLAWRNLPFSPMLIKELWENVATFDVVHSNEFRSPHSYAAEVSASRNDVPHLLQPRGTVPRHSKSGIKQIFDLVMGEKLLTESERIIASSHIESNQYSSVVDISDDRIIHVPNGINAESERLVDDPTVFREQFSISPEAPLVLFLSRLHKRKGADLLIEAFAKLRSEYPDAQLAIVGPDEGHLDELETLASIHNIENAVLFTGPLYDEDKSAAYAAADVFILPSKNQYESFGNVILEALVHDTPTVATNVCGASEWIEFDQFFSVNPTVEALFSGIVSGYQSDIPDEEGLKYVKSEFSWERIAAMMETNYSGVMR